MTLVYRSTIGRRLTVSEGDGNISELSGSAGITFLPSGTGPGSRTLQTKVREVEFSLMDKSGAVADGVTDLTTQWANFIADANAQIAAAVLNGYPITTYKAVIPSGDYVIATGATMVNCNLIIEGKGKETVRLRIGAGQYLLTVTSSIYQLDIRGISTSGGKGIVAHTATGNSVLGVKVIENNNFHDYTECAIGSLSADAPYWHIRKNIFYGAGALTSKGVAFAGDVSGSVIEDNEFQQNRYHLKLARSGVNIKIHGNDFIRFTDGAGAPKLTDIWVVGSSGSTDTGLTLSQNKFGNEARNAADYVLLIADEAAGTNFFDKNHATTASSTIVAGVTMRDNNVSGTGTPSNGVIYSYTPNIRGWTVDDVYTGSKFPYVFHFDAGVTVAPDRDTEQTFIRLGRADVAIEASNWGNYSNAPSIAVIDDPLGLLSGYDNYRSQYSAAFDSSFADLWTTASSGARLLNQSSTTRSNIADSIGGADAAEYTFSTAGGTCSGYMAATTINRLAWVELELKKSTTNPVSQVMVDIRYDADTAIPFRRIIKLPTAWQRVRFPWVPRSTSSVQRLAFYAVDYSAGVADRFQVGRIKIYHASEAQHFGARYLEAFATYDPPSLADGAGTTTTVTVTGAVLGDYAVASFSLDVQGITITAYISAADTVSVRFQNESGGVLDLASGTLRCRVMKKDS